MRINLPKFNIDKSMTFDTECTTDREAHLWLSSFTYLNAPTLKETVLHYNIRDTFNFLFQRKHRGYRVYVHNLGYDIRKITTYLRDTFPDEDVAIAYIHPPMGSFMYVSIEFRHIKLHFIDTVGKFAGLPLKKVLEAFVPSLPKGDTPIRETVASIGEITDYDKHYAAVDACGLACAVIRIMENGTGLTLPSDAWREWKRIRIEELGHQDRFNEWYPTLDEATDTAMRVGYRGGITFLNVPNKGDIYEGANIRVFDVNSMYPYQMKENLLPYGDPLVVEKGRVETNKKWKLGIQRIRFTFAHIKPGKMRFIPTKGGTGGVYEYDSEIYPKDGYSTREEVLTLQELECFLESYEVEDLEFIGGWKFRASKESFTTYIDKFLVMKNSKDPVEKLMGKLFLNSLYGKFAENPKKWKSEFNIENENHTVKTSSTEYDYTPKGYLPIGLFITSYARLMLVNSINAGGLDEFIYCDTDSMHVKEGFDNSKLWEHPSDLGAWDHESTFTEAKYIRAKRYMGKCDDGEWKFACAGINKNDLKAQCHALSDFYPGKEINTRKFVTGANGKWVRPQVTKI